LSQKTGVQLLNVILRENSVVTFAQISYTK